MDNDNQIRQRIQKLVIMSGLTKPKFAEKIGFNKANFNLILNGNRKVPESLVFAIISNKIASFEYLVNGTECECGNSNKSISDISSGGNTTIHNGESEQQSKRADAITNKMLDMIAEKVNLLEASSNSFISELHAILAERNQRIDKLFELIDEKDRQLRERDNQINRLLDLLSQKKKG